MKLTEQDIPITVINQIRTKIRQCIKLAEAAFNQRFYMPTVVFNVTNSAAGYACSGSNTIRLNPTLLMQNVNDFLTDTVPHEFAHIVADIVYPTGHLDKRKKTKRVPHHGTGWKHVMGVFGLPPRVHHGYAVEHSVRSQRYPHTCSVCGELYQLTVKQAESVRIRAGSLFHNRCGKDSKFIPIDKNELPLSKYHKCEMLYTNNRTAGRVDLIEMFINQAQTTPAGAATYYAKLRNKYDH